MNTRNSSQQNNPSPSRGSGARPGVWPRAAALLLASALMLGPLTALAQETPPDPDIQALDKRKKELEVMDLELKVANAARDARFPKPTSSPLAGTTTTNDAAFIEELIQGYNSVNTVADAMVGRICGELPTKPSVIVVHNQSSVGLMTTYAAGMKRIDVLQSRYKDVIKEMQVALAEDKERDKAEARKALRTGASDARGGAEGRSLIAGLGAATSVVGSFVDFLAFFRSNVDIKGTTFDVNNGIFVSSVFDAFRQNRLKKCTPGVKLYSPATVPPNLASPAGSPLLNEMEELYALREEAEDLKRQIDERVAKKRKQIAELQKLVDAAQKAIKKYEDDQAKKGGAGGGEGEGGSDAVEDPMHRLPTAGGGNRGTNARRRGNKPPAQQQQAQPPAQKPDPRDDLRAEIAKNEELIAALEDDIAKLNHGARRLPGVNTQFDNLLKDLLAVEQSSGISLLTGYLLTESLRKTMENDGSYWLVLDVVKAGGNRKVKSNLILDVFRGGAKITHSGGAVVHFNVYDRDGASLLSGVHSKYLKYRSADKIE